MTLDTLQYWFLILVNAGIGLRIVYLLIIIMTSASDDNLGNIALKKRLKHLFLVLAVVDSLVGLKSLFLHYFGG